MFRNLMHAFTGSPMQNAAQGTVNINAMNAAMQNQAIQNSILRQEPRRYTASKKIFSGNIEVQQVSNGFVVNIGTKEGYEYTTHIAQTITEVNEIIAAAMVAFQLEQ